MTKPIEEAKKNGYDLQLYKEDTIRKAFTDEGASITACGKGIASVLNKYTDNSVKSTFTAGGMDASETGKFHKSSIKYKVPTEILHFDVNDGENKMQKIYLRIWFLPCINDDLLIIGRDGKKELCLGTVAHNDLKKMIYYHSRNQSFDEPSSDEKVTNFIDKLEYRHDNDPWTYRITPSNQVTKVNVKFAKKSECHQLNKINAIETINSCELTDDDEYIKKSTICPKKDAFTLNNGDLMNRSKESSSCIKIIDNENIESEDENGIKLKPNINLSTSTTIKTAKLKGKTVSYPASLDKLHYSSLYAKQEIIQHKVEMSKYADVLAKNDFDVGKDKYHKPLKILVKNEEQCKILPSYPLNPADKAILGEEIELWTNNNLMKWQQQHKEEHVKVHASPAFVVHKEPGSDTHE